MNAIVAPSIRLSAIVRSASGRKACLSRRKNSAWARAWLASGLDGAASTARCAAARARPRGSGRTLNPNMNSSL